jgi:sugar/nucleoside kinase (ribokinase family)
MVQQNPTPRDLFVGEFRREYSLTSEEEWILDAPGGNALYAAVGYRVWEKDQVPGLLTRVGEDFPQSWLEDFSNQGLDVNGVVVLPQAVDIRSCFIQQGNSTDLVGDPIPYLSRLGVALPQGLIGYPDSNKKTPDNRRTVKITAIREGDIPPGYLTATGAHLCPMDYLSHNLLPAILRQQGFSAITLDPSPSYMNSTYFGDIPALITGLTAFLPSEQDLLTLYKGKSADLWEIAADLGRHGCEFVVIKKGAAGQYLFDTASGRKWEINPYPARVKNLSGAGSSFCGGFLAGFRQTFDPLQAVLYGSVAASLVIEGSGPFFALKALPGLAQARLEALQGAVREV